MDGALIVSPTAAGWNGRRLDRLAIPASLLIRGRKAQRSGPRPPLPSHWHAVFAWVWHAPDRHESRDRGSRLRAGLVPPHVARIRCRGRGRRGGLAGPCREAAPFRHGAAEVLDRDQRGRVGELRRPVTWHSE